MARPKSKKELLDLSARFFLRFMDQVDGIYTENGDAEFPVGTMNRNMKDVMAHVHEWHNMMIEWYSVGMSGEKPKMPKEGYTWKTVPALNKVIWEMYKEEDFSNMQKKLKSSHSKVMALIDSHSDEELFTKKKYNWTGSTSLGAYLISSTSSHYDWAYKLIKKCSK